MPLSVKEERREQRERGQQKGNRRGEVGGAVTHTPADWNVGWLYPYPSLIADGSGSTGILLKCSANWQVALYLTHTHTPSTLSHTHTHTESTTHTYSAQSSATHLALKLKLAFCAWNLIPPEGEKMPKKGLNGEAGGIYECKFKVAGLAPSELIYPAYINIYI